MKFPLPLLALALSPFGQVSPTAPRPRPFTGCTSPDKGPNGAPEDCRPKCFILLDGKMERLPTAPWATEARYTPGQVWCPRHVPRTDVNPRPLSTLVPSNGLIGCFSA